MSEEIDVYITKKSRKIKYQYKCRKCGNCCHKDWDIGIQEEDILKWDQLGKKEVLKYLQINPMYISPTGLGGPEVGGMKMLEIKEGEDEKEAMENAFKKAKEFNKEEFQKFLESIKNFVLKNHRYLGEGDLDIPIHPYFEGKGNSPIFSPQSFQIMLDGMKLGLKYIINWSLYKKCPFLKGNLCSIHEIKPWACRMFPFTEEGKLRLDERAMEVCKGFKPVSFIN